MDVKTSVRAPRFGMVSFAFRAVQSFEEHL